MNLNDYSNFDTVFLKARHYYGKNVKLLQSSRKAKKYMIYNPYNNKFVHFGQMGYKDFTKYVQLYDLETANEHRKKYLKRALKIRGNWKDNPYSPNFLSMLLLWDF